MRTPVPAQSDAIYNVGDDIAATLMTRGTQVRLASVKCYPVLQSHGIGNPDFQVSTRVRSMARETCNSREVVTRDRCTSRAGDEALMRVTSLTRRVTRIIQTVPVSLLWRHPTSFVLFLLVGGVCLAAGIVLYLLAVLKMARR